MEFTARWSEKGKTDPDALTVRRTVFMEEQKFTYDEDDNDGIAYHLTLRDENGRAVGAARIFEDHGAYHAGRICILPDYRGMDLGLRIMREIEKKAASLAGDRVILGAQMRASGFYKKAGYETYGDPYYEEYCEHINMQKKL